MAERRRLERKQLIFYLKVFEQDTNELVGHLSDVSTEGFKLISEKPVTIDQRFDLKMSLSKKTVGGEQVLFRAVSMWCRKNSQLSDFFDVGFQFIDLLPVDHKKLEKWFHETWFKVE